jgi:hypothetical protein
MSSIYRQCTSKSWAVQEEVQKMKTPNWNINSWVIAFVRWSFFFLYGLVRVFSNLIVSKNRRSVCSSIHPFRDSQKESDQEIFWGFRPELLSGY